MPSPIPRPAAAAQQRNKWVNNGGLQAASQRKDFSNKKVYAAGGGDLAHVMLEIRPTCGARDHKAKTVRALLDTGSNVTAISKRCAAEMIARGAIVRKDEEMAQRTVKVAATGATMRLRAEVLHSVKLSWLRGIFKGKVGRNVLTRRAEVLTDVVVSDDVGEEEDLIIGMELAVDSGLLDEFTIARKLAMAEVKQPAPQQPAAALASKKVKFVESGLLGNELTAKESSDAWTFGALPPAPVPVADLDSESDDEDVPTGDDWRMPGKDYRAREPPVPFAGTPAFQQRLEQLLDHWQAQGLFEESIGKPCRFPAMEIELTPDAVPKAFPPRRYSPEALKAMKENIDVMLTQGVIRECESPWCAATVMARKKNEFDQNRKTGWRFATDFRWLNQFTVANKWPIRRTADVILRLKGMRVFATIDLRSGFWQNAIAEGCQHLLCFGTPFGSFCYTRLPMGLKNSSSHFQHCMQTALQGLEHICEAYVDDVTVWAEDEEQFLENLNRVLGRLHEWDLKLKRSKCHFGLGRVDVLGFSVDGEGTRLSETRKQGLREIVKPASVPTLRSFMGMANYCRDYVPNFAVLAKPLTALCG